MIENDVVVSVGFLVYLVLVIFKIRYNKNECKVCIYKFMKIKSCVNLYVFEYICFYYI